MFLLCDSQRFDFTSGTAANIFFSVAGCTAIGVSAALPGSAFADERR